MTATDDDVLTALLLDPTSTVEEATRLAAALSSTTHHKEVQHASENREGVRKLRQIVHGETLDDPEGPRSDVLNELRSVTGPASQT